MLIGMINSVAFRLFGIPIYWYAIIIVSGVVIATVIAANEAGRVGLKKDDIYDFMLWALPISIVCARLYYVAFEWPYYSQHPIEIFAIRNGGIAIYGGLIGGGLTAFFFCRYRYLSIWKFLDIAAPSVILAQAIGRWGNFMNHEAYGPDTTRAFLESLHLPKFIIDNMKIEGIYRQPTFLYESVWNFIGFLILIVLRRYVRALKEGEIALLYVAWYSFGRFFIEGLRQDSLMIGHTIRVSQLLSVFLFIGSLIILLIRRVKFNVPLYQQEKQEK